MDTRFDKREARVGVLMGGLSAERAVSIMSGQGVLGALRERGWNAVEVLIDRNADKTIRDANIDVAFVALHGKFGEDGCIQGLLEVMGIPYTGSGVQASALCMDKVRTKRALEGVPGIAMKPHGFIVYEDEQALGMIPYPVVVKPRRGGSSLGISLVKNADDLRQAAAIARNFDREVFWEEFISGMEISVPVLSDDEVLPVVGIVPPNPDTMFDFEAKYTKGKTIYSCPPDLPARVLTNAQCAAVNAYAQLGCRGYARADFMVQDGLVYFLEMNTIPGLTATSLVPLSAGTIGMSYGELCEAILQSATCEQEEFPPAT